MHSVIEPHAGQAWMALDAGAKRDRLLAAAERVFAERGLDAPMPAIASAAGAGVGSLYRQFASKDELVAALAERRLSELQAALDDALAVDDAWAGLQAFVWRALGDDGSDDVAAQAIASSSAFKPVRKARKRVHSRLETLIERAKAQGTIRGDATRVDITMTIVGARAVRHVRPDDWRRMVQLTLDGLRARPKRR
jgi:AcrR family transcriptional regulator